MAAPVRERSNPILTGHRLLRFYFHSSPSYRCEDNCPTFPTAVAQFKCWLIQSVGLLERIKCLSIYTHEVEIVCALRLGVVKYCRSISFVAYYTTVVRTKNQPFVGNKAAL